MPKQRRFVLLAVLAAALLAGCGGEDDPVAPRTVDPEVDSYIEDLPTWAEVSPPLLTADVPTDTSTSCLDGGV